MKKILTILIVIYQNTLSAYTPTCRFEPSCSQYMKEAIETHGAWKGLWIGIKRLGRCHPCSGRGGYDPVG